MITVTILMAGHIWNGIRALGYDDLVPYGEVSTPDRKAFIGIIEEVIATGPGEGPGVTVRGAAITSSTDAPLNAAELAEIRDKHGSEPHPRLCTCDDIHRLLSHIDSLTARSSEITDEAVEAACEAYNQFADDWSEGDNARHAMREALEAAEATRGEA